MTNSQKIIKYFAIAFAIFLIYTISSAIITSAGIIIKSFDKKKNREGWKAITLQMLSIIQP